MQKKKHERTYHKRASGKSFYNVTCPFCGEVFSFIEEKKRFKRHDVFKAKDINNILERLEYLENKITEIITLHT